MTKVLLLLILLVGVSTLAVAVGALRSSRRAEDVGEDRYELLRDQQSRLDVLREERQMLVEQLTHESQERRTLIASLEGADPRLADKLEQERLLLEDELRRLGEQLKQEQGAHSGTQQEMEELRQEHQRLAEDSQRVHEEYLKAQRSVEQQGQELTRMKKELESRRLVFDRQIERSTVGRMWWRRPLLVVTLLIGILVMWVTSLVVALTFL